MTNNQSLLALIILSIFATGCTGPIFSIPLDDNARPLRDDTKSFAIQGRQDLENIAANSGTTIQPPKPSTIE